MLYFDASYLIPLVKLEPLSERVQSYVESMVSSQFVTSFWTIVECRSALAREVRMGGMSEALFRSCCAALDLLTSRSFVMLVPNEDDYRSAAAMIEDAASGLRSGDAVHLAIAARLRTDLLLTLDRRLISIGTAIGISTGRGFSEESA